MELDGVDFVERQQVNEFLQVIETIEIASNVGHKASIGEVWLVNNFSQRQGVALGVAQSGNKGLGAVENGVISDTGDYYAGISDFQFIVLEIGTQCVVESRLNNKGAVTHNVDAIELQILREKVLHLTDVVFTALEERWRLERDEVRKANLPAVVIDCHLFGRRQYVVGIVVDGAVIQLIVDIIHAFTIGIVGGGTPLAHLLELAALNRHGDGVVGVAIENHMAAVRSVPQVYKLSLHHHVDDQRVTVGKSGVTLIGFHLIVGG